MYSIASGTDHTCRELAMLEGQRGLTNLIRINHQNISLVVTNNISCNRQSAPVLLNTCSNLQLEMPVSFAQSLL
jgi:hypothetical protein